MKGQLDHEYSDEELRWAGSHLDDVAAYVRGERVLRWILGSVLVLGLVINLLGYWVGSGASGLGTGFPADLVSDLLDSFGVALWTSVVIVVALEMWPQQQRRNVELYARGAVAALKARGATVEVELPPPDHAAGTDAKLDAILDRLAAVERSLGSRIR